MMMSVIIISCGGCKCGEVVSEVDKIKVESIDKVESKEHVPSATSQYPIVHGIITTLNDSTQNVDGVVFVRTTNTQKITFPNGKVITNDNFPIVGDLPKKYLQNSGEYYGFYDFSKISDNKKEAILANMDGFDPLKLKNYTEALYSFQYFKNYNDEQNKTSLERVFVVSDLTIFEEVRRSKDDIRQFVIGRIGYMEVYDKQGNLINKVSLDKFGCSDICVTPDKKYIIIHSKGRNDNTEMTFNNNGAIVIYDYNSFEQLGAIMHFPNDYASGKCLCDNNNIGLISIIPDSDSLHFLNYKIKEQLVFTLKLSSDKKYKVNFIDSNRRYFQFYDGTKIEKDDPDFKQFSLVEWNNYVRSVLSLNN